MTEPAKNARREYYRQWRKRNPDKVRATQERYWMKKAAERRSMEPGAAARPGQHETDK